MRTTTPRETKSENERERELRCVCAIISFSSFFVGAGVGPHTPTQARRYVHGKSEVWLVTRMPTSSCSLVSCQGVRVSESDETWFAHSVAVRQGHVDTREKPCRLKRATSETPRKNKEVIKNVHVIEIHIHNDVLLTQRFVCCIRAHTRLHRSTAHTSALSANR